MTTTDVTVDLGGSPIGESITITVVGAPCRLRKALEDVQAVLKGHRAMHLAEDSRPAQKKPCGCGEANAGQR